MSTIPPRFANVQAATAMENRIKALDLGVKIESDLRQRSEGQECITEYTVSIKITNPKTGNGVVRNILPDASDKDIKCLVREMKAQLKGQNTRTAAQIRGERIVDSE